MIIICKEEKKGKPIYSIVDKEFNIAVISGLIVHSATCPEVEYYVTNIDETLPKHIAKYEALRMVKNDRDRKRYFAKI